MRNIRIKTFIPTGPISSPLEVATSSRNKALDTISKYCLTPKKSQKAIIFQFISDNCSMHS